MRNLERLTAILEEHLTYVPCPIPAQGIDGHGDGWFTYDSPMELAELILSGLGEGIEP